MDPIFQQELEGIKHTYNRQRQQLKNNNNSATPQSSEDTAKAVITTS
jgi:hypothetical protein